MNQARASRITGSRRISYRCSIRFTCSCVTCPMAILLECFRLSAEIALDSAQSSKASRDARPPVARLQDSFLQGCGGGARELHRRCASVDCETACEAWCPRAPEIRRPARLGHRQGAETTRDLRESQRHIFAER